MAKKKLCYRVQVGAAKLGLVSKCMDKKTADKMRKFVDTGGLMSWVFKDKPKNKRDWVTLP